MSLVDNGGMYMPVAPAGNGYGGNGMFGDGCFWLIVLFLFAFMGNGWGGMGAGNGAMPYVMNQNTGSEVQRGFDQQAVMGGIGALQAGQNAMAQNQCQQFAGVNQNIFNAAAAAEANAAARQMAGMQQNWGMQTDLGNRLDGIQMAQQSGLFENRAAIADVKYAIATDGAATRSNTDAKVQTVLDELGQMKYDNMKQNYENRINDITQNYENRLSAMQAQLAALADQVNKADRRVAMGEEIDGLYNRLKNCPVGTVPVAGNVPIFSMKPSCPCNGGVNQMIA